MIKILNEPLSINEPLSKKEVVRIPYVDFGISAQSPDYFQNQHSMISNHSYINPFVKMDKFNLSKIKSTAVQIKKFLKPQQWTSRAHHNNYSHLKNQNGFLTGRSQAQQIASGLNHSIEFDQTFQKIVNQEVNSKLFHKKKGEFTSYLQNHLLNVDLSGPMLGDERSIQRKRETKQKLLKQKFQALQTTKQKYSRIKPNKSLSPLLQKTKIHVSRLILNNKVHQQYKEKQNIKQKTKNFELPKINKNELEDSLSDLKETYKRFKNDNLTKSFFVSCVSSVKTADFDKSGLISKISKVR